MRGTNQPTNQPTNQAESLAALHCSKIGGDPAADERIAAVLVPLLVLRLRHRWSRTDGDAIETAAHDVVLWYLAEPTRYDGTSARLDVFLAHVAHRRMQDVCREDRRRLVHGFCVGAAQRWVALEGARDPRAATGEREERAATRRRLMSIARTGVEEQFLAACLRDGAGRTVAAVLGIEHLSASEQARAVCRLTKRLHQRAVREAARRDGVSKGTRTNE